MELIFAIIMRELVGWPRHRRFYVKRLAYVIGGCLVVLAGFSRDWVVAQHDVGAELFRLLALIAVAVACFAAPATASTFFAREREVRTLGLLLLAPITPLQLVVCRLFSGLFATGVTVLSFLPLFILCISLGGLTAAQIAAALAVLLATVCLGTCLGLLISVLMMDEMMSFFAVLVLSACVFVAFPGLIYLLGADLPEDLQKVWVLGRVLPMLSPFYAVNAVFGEQGWLPSLFYLATALPAAAVLLALTVWLLPRQAEATNRAMDPRLAASIAAAHKRKPITGNPLVWKETADIGYGLYLFSMAAGILLALPWGMSQGQVGLAVGLAVFGASVVITGLGLLVRGSLAFVHEKEMRTFELLLISGLDEEDIIMGKYWGYLRNYAPWLLSMAVAFVLMAFYENFLTVAMSYLLFLTLLFTYFNLAFLLSLLCRRMTALLVTFFLFVFWSGAGAFLIRNLDRYLALTVSVVVSHLIAGCALLELVFIVFHQHTHNEKYLTSHRASSHHWGS